MMTEDEFVNELVDKIGGWIHYVESRGIVWAYTNDWHEWHESSFLQHSTISVGVIMDWITMPWHPVSNANPKYWTEDDIASFNKRYKL